MSNDNAYVIPSFDDPIRDNRPLLPDPSQDPTYYSSNQHQPVTYQNQNYTPPITHPLVNQPIMPQTTLYENEKTSLIRNVKTTAWACIFIGIFHFFVCFIAGLLTNFKFILEYYETVHFPLVFLITCFGIRMLVLLKANDESILCGKEIRTELGIVAVLCAFDWWVLKDLNLLAYYCELIVMLWAVFNQTQIAQFQKKYAISGI
eukprot:TRINITY_DN1753_c0_g1_i1.p1 TRINITY_DN1753_c0_g1~~TRINITY_DN1753_c0_g1_i1.p1  ORF type:complete len:204 (+),score=34.63 TRINITY_DN1753_c0_g1_i1:154-765(+)